MKYLRLSNIGTDMHNYSHNNRNSKFINLYRRPNILEDEFYYYTSTFGVDIEVIN